MGPLTEGPQLMSRVEFKGNLSHKFMGVYFLYLLFHLDISKMLKNVDGTGWSKTAGYNFYL